MFKAAAGCAAYFAACAIRTNALRRVILPARYGQSRTSRAGALRGDGRALRMTIDQATIHNGVAAAVGCGERALGTFNIAAHLPRMATVVPDQAAVVVTESRNADGHAFYASLTFAELEALSNRYANGLQSVGVARGMRTLLMVRPGFEFIGVVFALFKMGAVPVMIDPGMGVSRLLECVRQVDLQAFIGVPLAHLMRVLRRGSFRSVRHAVTVGRRWCWGGATLDGVTRRASETFAPVETGRDETAAILFTSGSTGPAKGVVYEHGMFGAQVDAIQRCYDIQPGEIDLPAFPLFALFSTAMGMTSVIPDMDPSRPVTVDPARIVAAINDHQVTNTFGSPAIWRKVADYCVERDARMPSLKRILVAGAPVPYSVIERLHQTLSDAADVHTPYGATESLPVSSISGREVLADCREQGRHGAGNCVGQPLAGVDLRVIGITDEAIEVWSDDLVVPDGERGEIVVSGPVVTKAYFGLPDATRTAKIIGGDRIWHRIGDIGYKDAAGRVWFCGRKAHRVRTEGGTLFSVCCEAIFNEHPDVLRSALVGVGEPGRQRPVIVIEPRAGRFPTGGRTETMTKELLALGAANELTDSILTVLFHRDLPVDVRHNAKINREALAVWAAGKLA